MSGDILQTPDASKPQGARIIILKLPLVAVPFAREVLAGLTTFPGDGLLRYRSAGNAG